MVQLLCSLMKNSFLLGKEGSESGKQFICHFPDLDANVHCPGLFLAGCHSKVLTKAFFGGGDFPRRLKDLGAQLSYYASLKNHSLGTCKKKSSPRPTFLFTHSLRTSLPVLPQPHPGTQFSYKIVAPWLWTMQETGTKSDGRCDVC